MLLTHKYSPKKIDEIIGNEEVMAKIKQWIYNWLRGQKKKALLINGPPGIGKTSVAHALMREFDLELIEMSSSDLRNKNNIEKVLAGASLASSLTGKKKLFLIDDIDTLSSADRGGAGSIVKIIKENEHPVIVTAINPWDRKLAGIRTECELVEMKKVSKTAIRNLLKKIKEKENINVNDELLERIAENCVGDVRSAINDLQAQSSSIRDRQKDVFERLRIIFKSKTYKDAKAATFGDIDYDLLKLWLDENIPNEYEKVEDLANAYNALSRADMFEGRIRKSYWIYLKYCMDLISVGIALAKREPYYKFTRYVFPKYLREMSKTIERRALMKSIGLKIGGVIHTNARTAVEVIPLLKEIGADKEELLMNLYHLEEDELAFIMRTTVEKISTKTKKN